MKNIDCYEYQGEGYDPFLITRKWQVAFLNYAQSESLESIEKLDIHHCTDEVFVLLKGHAVLIAASIDHDCVEYDVIDMLPGVVYNIRKDTWHKIAMQEGCQIFIVENKNTHLVDFEFYNLSDIQKYQLISCVKQCIKSSKR